MNVTGMIQLFCAVSLLFAGFSQHSVIDSFCKELPLARPFVRLLKVLFVVLWPFYRLKNAKHSTTIICLVVILYFMTEFCRTYAPRKSSGAVVRLAGASRTFLAAPRFPVAAPDVRAFLAMRNLKIGCIVR
jgi:hypothetical protein